MPAEHQPVVFLRTRIYVLRKAEIANDRVGVGWGCVSRVNINCHGGFCIGAFSCDVIAAMLEGKNIIFMKNCFIVSTIQHGRRENLYRELKKR